MTSESDGTPTPASVPSSGYTPPPPGYAPQPPGYPPVPYGYVYVRPRPTNGYAIAALIVSIASFVVCPLVATAGVVLGYKARAQIRERDEEGDGLALAGIIVGWFGIAYSVFIVLFFAFFLMIPFWGSMN